MRKAKRETAKTQASTIVGVGASAGGLAAFTRLLRGLPTNTGIGFVLVPHLAPSRASLLAQILARVTQIPVTEVVEDVLVEPNSIYVIPPDRNMSIEAGHLRLTLRDDKAVQHPIDFFFKSLAASKRKEAVGVVLSGTATDGTAGLVAIKEAGGITFAQNATALHSGMPESAVASGCVDFVLSPEDIAKKLVSNATPILSAVRRSSHRRDTVASTRENDQECLPSILLSLKTATGVDFSMYKPNTLLRRVRRRMTLQKYKDFNTYARIIAADATEAQALIDDFLINVTRFFRDTTVFNALRKDHLPSLIREHKAIEPIRVWVVGCATGEEAYSLAMILTEAAEATKSLGKFKIFATDISDECIRVARKGVYASDQMKAVSPARTSRFFSKTGEDFQVRKELRELCQFSKHNVIGDPPLSRMDFISCRNLLIYLEPAMQRSVLSALTFALRPQGLLLLGNSEAVARGNRYFSAMDRKLRIYKKTAVLCRSLPQPRATAKIATPSPTAPQRASAVDAAPTASTAALSFAGENARYSTRELLAALAPTAVILNGDLEVVEFYGDTEVYLTQTQGRASLALLKMAREGLRVPLQVLLRQVQKEKVPLRDNGVNFRSREGRHRVNLRAIPLADNSKSKSGFLVIFEEDVVSAPQPARKSHAGRRGAQRRSDGKHMSEAAQIVRLERDLLTAQRYLEAITEQYQEANEDLQVSNEEAQATSEEFQSINEELETSKEEIQSSNEELTTINDELTNRNLDLAHLTADLANLIQGTHMAIVIVAEDLCIRRFSPMAEKILSLSTNDIGRSINEIRSPLTSFSLGMMVTDVIKSRHSQEREIESEDGHWYSIRVHPYFAEGSRNAGAVLSLVDITVIRRAREYSESILATVQKPLLVLDQSFRIRNANRYFCTLFGFIESEIAGTLLFDLGDGEWNIPELHRPLALVLPNDAPITNYMMEQKFKGLGLRSILLNARRLLDPFRGEQSILISLEDVTLRKQNSEALIQSNADLTAQDAAKNHFLGILSHELRSPLNIIRLWSQILQRSGCAEPTLREGLAIIDRSSKTQARLVEDLLDVHRITSGKLWLELSSTVLQDILLAALAAVEPLALQRGVRLSRDFQAIPLVVECDPLRMQQVFAILLDNSLKFTPPGGEIAVALSEVKGHATITVRDTGIGMDSSLAPALFSPSRQADPLTIRSHGGLGLGLSIARQLVILHKGVVNARSAGKGKGMTITVSLPIQIGRLGIASPRINMTGFNPDIANTLTGIRVLVVDDEADARKALRLLLVEAGAEITDCESTDAALAAIEKQVPDIILSDIAMPNRDGYDFIRSLRALSIEHGGRVPAIAITAFAALEDRQLALTAGFQVHLAKPLEAVALIHAIRSLVASPALPSPDPAPAV